MGRGKKALCLLAFSLVCIGLLLFLHAFTVEHNTVTYLEWSAASVASPEGEETPFAPLSPPPALGEGQIYRFRTALPPQDGTQVLLFEVDGMELAVYAGGELLYRSAAEFPPETMSQGTMQLPLPPGQGQELVMEVRPVGEGPDIFPPFPRLTDDPTDMDGVTAYANRLALPAGAAALALVLVWGLFLISLLHGQPNWSLIPLSLAALGLTVFRLSQGVGGFFLPQPVLVVCQWRGLGVLTSAALLVYLLMNRRRGFYRSFGLAALVSAGILLFACLLSLPFGGGLPRYLVSQIHALLQTGFYDGLSTWITLWLTAVCALLSAAETVRTLAQTRAQARAARIQYQLTLENYQQSLEKNRQTAALRHEWKNQVAALRLMAQRGDLSAMEQRLEGLEGDLNRLSDRTFTQQPAINTILQHIAHRAGELGVDFRAQVMTPPELPLDEGDLCVLLLNMLDNALESAARVEAPRQRTVRCRISLTQGYLAVRCENTYTGPLSMDSRGRLRTTKADPDSHGFGLAQMRAVAEKYHGMLDLSHDGERFTVEAALKLP